MHAFDTSLDEDLKALSALFWQQNIAHRIYESGGRQVVELADPSHLDYVRDAYQQFRSGQLQLTLTPRATVEGARSRHPLRRIAQTLPIFTTIACIAIILFPVAANYFGMGRWLNSLSFMGQTEFTYRAPLDALSASLRSGQLWRLVTPVFLHFSFVHIGFNLAMMYEFGRRLEASIAPGVLLVGVMVMAIVSNTAQFFAISHASFGGLSGVVYGLFGALVVLGRRFPEAELLRLQDPFIVIMLVFLVAFSTGVTESFGLNIANTAHWSGFAVGVAFGACVSIRRTNQGTPQTRP